MDLMITTTNGAIGINAIQGKMNIDYGKSNFNIQTENPEIDINITHPKVEIDQTKPLAEMGLQDIFDFIKNNASRGRQAALNGIGKIASQGNELASIETGSNVISRQAQYNAFKQYKREVNIDFIPKSRPEIDLREGIVNINLEEGEVEIDNEPQEVNLNFNKGQVKIYLRQKPSIAIEYIGKNLDMNI
ncbi:MAG: DUF6470 family protein [Maledivibacter sp.]|jgi:hypothetical protein|nr:DUF6470 family protein [Maledivibacter sp.]